MAGPELLHQKFSAVAGTRKTIDAVVCPDASICYEELDLETDRLARVFAAKGLVPGSQAIICLPTGIAFIKAVLGVMKAGGIHVPLDINDPVPRTRELIANLTPALVITRRSETRRFDPALELPVFFTDDPQKDDPMEGEPVSAGPEFHPLPAPPTTGACHPAPLAYIMHTSGSTGVPKGIGISHRAVLNLIHAFNRIRPVGKGDRCSIWGSLSFDASIYEIWSALVSGATLCIPNEEIRFDPDRFLDWLCEKKITSAFIPPFMIAPMASRERLPALNRMLTGVAPIPEPLLCTVKGKIPGLTLINGYGPAEATVCATLYTVPDIPLRQGKAPIGTPVDNLDVVLADDNGQPVMPGEKGEILISGVQVANGYVNAPDRTALAFTRRDGRWFYKTGDMAYCRDDGNLVYLGRKDFQIKHRGVRIEPGEIESQLETFPGVSQAAVVLRPGRTGDMVLTAVINAHVDKSGLMDFLKDRLPRTMLPGAVICLENLPQTPQGKVDREALAQKDLDRDAPVSDKEAPAWETTTQERAARIWESVLGTRPDSGAAHFLVLGGDSIAGIKIISRLREAFGKDIRLNALFDYPEFSRFCDHLAAAPDLVSGNGPGREPDDPVDTPLPLLPDQEFIWVFEHINPGTPVYHLPLVYEFSGELDTDRLKQALDIVQARHPALSTRFALTDGHPVQVPGNTGVSVEITSLQELGIPTSKAIDIDAPGIRDWLNTCIAEAFDLENEPLLRAGILRIAPDRFLVCFVFHHLVFDGWSVSLFTQALARAYKDLGKKESGKETPASGTNRQATYRRFIRQRLAQAEQARQASRPFYRAYLSDLPPGKTEDGPPFDARSVPVRLPLKQEIRDLSNRFNVSPFTTLLTFFQISLFLRDRQEDQVTGIAYAGRDGIDAESMIGFFMNTLVARNRISGDITFTEALGRARQTLENIFNHARLPFREVSQICREVSDNPAPFTSLFLMQPMGFSGPDIPGTRVRPVSQATIAANVDLTLELYETDTEFSGTLKYRTTVYADEEAALMVDRLGRVVRQGLESPDTAIADTGQQQRFPVSPMQHGMLMETLRAPQGAGCYVEQIVFEMKQAVDIQRFGAAWEKVIHCHDILRLGFAWQGLDHPEQYITPPGAFKLEFNDWSSLSASEQNEFLDMFLKADRRLGFSLNTPPAFRVSLFKRTPSRFTCIWSFHHCLGDGRSMTYILRDLFLAYQDPGVRLPSPGSFRQYISWLGTHPKHPAKAFWAGYLDGFDAPLVFPFRISKREGSPSRRQPHAMPLTTGSHKLLLSSITSRKIKTLCNEHGLTMNAFLMGAWAVLLSHYTGKKDILFGTTVSVRNFEQKKGEHNGTDSTGADKTGMYINTVPVRIKIDPAQPLLAFIADIRTQWKEIRAHDHLSLTDIHALSPIRGSVPLSEIYFSYDYQTLDQSLALYKNAVSCSTISLLERTPAAIFLTVQGEDELETAIEYDQRKFNEKTTRQILNHFANFLKAATKIPDARLADLPVLTADEIRAIAQKLQTSQGYLKPKTCIHNLFEIQATVNKSVPAVTDGQTQLTYEGLNRFANRIAGFLAVSGGGPGKRILVFLEQNADIIAVLLGILKSGASYIPVDISAPSPRIRFIIRDACPDLILTESAHVDKLPDTGTTVLMLDREAHRIGQSTDSPPQVPVAPEHTAYIIYTSGSTGTPKGVEIQHSALASFTKSAAETYDIQPTDRVLQFAPISFDTSAEEIFPTLFAGACLVIKPRELVLTPEQLFVYCRTHKITVADLPTAYWHMVADQVADLELPARLRMVIIGGEAADPEKVRMWRRAVRGRIRLINTYGPTETTVAVTSAELSTTREIGVQVPIGRPFPDVSLCILNHFQQPAPPGVTGELYIGGPQVARSYLNLPEQTEQAFVSVKGSHPGNRFFKTGDHVFMQPSGEIVFSGRIDRQIKIRGYRIEPAEIEQTVMAHPDVREGAVAVSRSGDGNTEAVFFIVKKQGRTGPDIRELKSWMADRLPSYMVPSKFHVVDTLPYTPSGKIDYARLEHKWVREMDADPAPGPGTAILPAGMEDSDDTYVSGLIRVWQKVLGTNDIDLNDNFFDIGGSSLTAIQLVTAVEKHFGTSVPVLAVFRYPVLREMAALLREQDTGFVFSNLRVVKPKGDKPAIFFVAGTNEDTGAYGEQDLNGHPFYTLTVFAHKTVNNRIVPMDIWEIARKSVREITHVDPSGPYIIVGFCRYSIAAFEIASQLSSMGKQVDALVFLDEFWQEKGMSSFVGHHVKGMFRFGIRHILKKIVPKTREKIRMYALSLDQQREKIYARWGITAPESAQYRLMEAAFWQAYKSYLPRPYQGDILVMDSNNWMEKYDPKLRTYVRGTVRRIQVNATHRDWFKPDQIKTVIAALSEPDPDRPSRR